MRPLAGKLFLQLPDAAFRCFGAGGLLRSAGRLLCRTFGFSVGVWLMVSSKALEAAPKAQPGTLWRPGAAGPAASGQATHPSSAPHP
jgi:hypothetical protein